MPHFTQKVSKGKKIDLIEKRNVLPSDEEICSAFDICFANTVSNLNIPTIEHSHSNLQNSDPILATVNSTEKVDQVDHAIRRSVSEKQILTKLVKSLII